MKQISTIIIGFFLCSFLLISDGNYKRYQVESGIITYELSGMQSGTSTMYFDDWGRRESKFSETEISMMGFSSKTKIMELMDGVWMYNINLNSMTGTKTRNAIMDTVMKKSGKKDMTELGIDMMKEMGAKKIGTEVFLGKSCDIWIIESLGSKTWIWKGLTLRVETDMMGMKMTQIATSLKDGVDIPEDKFNIPEGVIFSETQDLQELMKGLNGFGK